jgi:hypothetical protein
MLNIEWIKQKICNNEYYYTKHGDQERQKEVDHDKKM